MIRAAFLAALLLLPAAGALASGPGSAPSSPTVTGTPSPLSDPGSYSLAPIAPPLLQQPVVAGGVASTSFGSDGLHTSSIELDSGLIGGNTRAFVAVGGGQGPHWHDTPAVQGQSFAARVSTALPFGTTLSVSAGLERDRFTHPY